MSFLVRAAVVEKGTSRPTGTCTTISDRMESIGKVQTYKYMAPRSVGRSVGRAVGPSEAFWSMLQAQVADISSETFFSI